MNITNLIVPALTAICVLGIGLVSVEAAGCIRAGRVRHDISATPAAVGMPADLKETDAALAQSMAKLDELVKVCMAKLETIERKVDLLIERGAL